MPYLYCFRDVRIGPLINIKPQWIHSSPQAPHVCVSGSGQHWFRQWLVACSAPSHYLNQCWVIVNWTTRKKNTQNSKLFIHKNIVCEMAAILSRGRWIIKRKVEIGFMVLQITYVTEGLMMELSMIGFNLLGVIPVPDLGMVTGPSKLRGYHVCVMPWKCFPHCWSIVMVIHRSPGDSEFGAFYAFSFSAWTIP